MNQPSSFQSFIARLRAGDQEAAASLVRSYEPEIRRAIRLRLTDPMLRAAFDSADVCQSILGRFFAKVENGHFQLETPRQLLYLLTAMARNSLIDRIRGEQSRKYRLHRDLASLMGTRDEPCATAIDDPAIACLDRDLLSELERRLPPDQRRVANLRVAGWTWEEIAAEVGGTAEALRKRFTRNCASISDDLDV